MMEFLQQVYAFFSYIREKLFRCGTQYMPVSGNASENLSSQNVGSPHIFSSNANENDQDVENQCVVFFDGENGMMYNKL